MIVTRKLWLNRCPNTSCYHATQTELISALITAFDTDSITSSAAAWGKTIQHLLIIYEYINPLKWTELLQQRQYFRYNDDKRRIKAMSEQIHLSEMYWIVAALALPMNSSGVGFGTRTHTPEDKRRRPIEETRKELLPKCRTSGTATFGLNFFITRRKSIKKVFSSFHRRHKLQLFALMKHTIWDWLNWIRNLCGARKFLSSSFPLRWIWIDAQNQSSKQKN